MFTPFVFERIVRVFFLFLSLCPVAGLHAATMAALGDTVPEYQVALVDKFYPGDQAFEDEEERLMQQALYGMLDIDGDRIREPLFHGDLVRILVQHPLIKILPYSLRHGANPLEELERNLALIRKDLFWGEPIDAVLLPWESSTLVSAFAEELSASSVDDYVNVVYQWGRRDEVWLRTWNIILLLEDIIEYGAKVYTISGNGGPRMVNTYSFAHGVVTVGAVERELQHYIADNVFVDLHERAAYQAERVDSVNGQPLGYDVTGDGCVDIGLELLSTQMRDQLPKRAWKVLKGSSFAAPVALRKALLGDVMAQCSSY